VITKKIHIVYVINSIRKSGPNQVLKNMIDFVDLNKFSVTVVSLLKTNDTNEVMLIKDRKVNFVGLDLASKKDIIFLAPNRLDKLFNDIKPDIVHSHGILSDIATYKVTFKTKHVTTIHSNMIEDYRESFGALLGSAYFAWHMYYLKKYDSVICCSKTSFELIKSKLPKSTYIRNGTARLSSGKTSSRNATRETLGLKSQDIIFIYTGVFTNRKNVLNLLESFSSSYKKNEYLIMLGTGPLYNLSKRYSCLNIKVLGFKDDVSDYLDAADIYVSASRSEGLSISIIEALSKGLHLLLSDIPSHREIIEIDRAFYLGELFIDNFNLSKQNVLSKMGDRKKITTFKNKYLDGRAMMRSYEKVYTEVIT
jgi:glycosyltransferase involved in cell wall biosynthesis